MLRLCCCLIGMLVLLFTLPIGSVAWGEETPAREGDDRESFAREKLVAWCIVPFDAARRSPDERGRMLRELGLRRMAYDWREEHLEQFDEEVAAMHRHGVEIVAWWMAGADLNDVNRKILDTVRRHKLRMQFWVSIGDPDASASQAEKVRICADAIRPLALEAAKLDCQVALYNHGGWYGEPENQLAILDALALDNVGIVYNQHHGHAHVDRFAELLDKMKPHLLALNLNGMAPRGDEIGKKILPIGAGEYDVALLRVIRDSGYRGPIGIIDHTDLDARARLSDNLLGLEWVLEQLDGGEPAAPPRMETYTFEGIPQRLAPQPDDQSRDERQSVEQLIAEAVEQGNAARGAAVFASHRFACVNCHRVGEQGGTIGPELTSIGRDRCAEEIVESLLWPARKVHPDYLAWGIVTDEGNIYQGYVVRDDGQQLSLREASTGHIVQVAHDAIEQRERLGTLMPEGLAAAMSTIERRDVVRFLLELGREGSAAEEWLAAAHRVAEFTFDKAPLEPSAWRYAQHPVNRDRVYDYYAKQADYFRAAGGHARLLPAFPGLDGGSFGHWGNQDEESWRDGRWNAMDCGNVMCGIVELPDRRIARGVCVRLSSEPPLTVCFNPDTLEYEAAWSGDFVQFSDVRSGLVSGMTPAGEFVELTAEARPPGVGHYRGYYRHGEQVIFSYDVDGVPYLDAPTFSEGGFVRVVAPASEHPLGELIASGPQQWPQVLQTAGSLGQGEGYAIDTILPPKDNPWNALFYFGGHDFLPDGSAMLCTMQGDVWHVSGLDENLSQVRWKRFATGLHHPQGLVVSDGTVYVLGRNQITRLHDLNGNGEADFYECFSRAFETSLAGHDFICGLERDAVGNFYTASGNQGLLRVSPDGDRVEVVATGFRNPDGLGLAPDGSITVPCSEGEWTPTSMICLVRGDALQPHFGYRGLMDGQPPELPLVYLPRGLDNSSGGQVYVDSDRWGPTRGQMVHLSYGMGTWFLLLRDEVRGQAQGAVVPMPGDFSAGAHRGKFHPVDGQLYVTGMAGWGTYTPEEGALERVRYTGAAVQLPTGFHVHENGIVVTFALPLAAEIASDAARQFAQAWNYRYSAAYGSAEYAPSHPGTIGHDRLHIASARVIDDGRKLFLEMPELQPVNQLHLRLQVEPDRWQELFITVHALDEPFTQFDGYRPQSKTVAAHPLLADLALLAQPPEPNPWREAIEGARPVAIEAGQNLTFSTRTATVRAGEAVQLTFANPDVVPHNWVLVQPASLSRVGDLVNRLVADPDSARRHYVPVSDDVLVYTDVVAAGESSTIYFRAPDQPGRYPYLCTFPGHWMVMNGMLHVE